MSPPTKTACWSAILGAITSITTTMTTITVTMVAIAGPIMGAVVESPSCLPIEDGDMRGVLRPPSYRLPTPGDHVKGPIMGLAVCSLPMTPS
jgi:hypothetical protein